MKRVWADFNARSETGDVSLSTAGSRQSILDVGGVNADERVLLDDGEVEVEAVVVIVRSATGLEMLVARPDEETWHDVRSQ